jgi:hypothetical protein
VTKKRTDVNSLTAKVETKCGTMKFIVDVDPDNDQVRGVSIVMAKPGSCAYTQAVGYTTLINKMIDYGLPFPEICKALHGVNDCGGSGKEGINCPAAIVRALKLLFDLEP